MDSGEDVDVALITISRSLAKLRSELENINKENLEQSVQIATDALSYIENFPGGLQELSAAISRLPEDKKRACEMLIKDCLRDHKIATELINLALQQNAAIKAYSAQRQPSATYSSSGKIPTDQDVSTLIGKL